MKKKQTKLVEEEYEVKLNYKKSNGYYLIGHKEIFTIQTNQKNAKNNHEKAAKLALIKFPNAKITKVTYC